MWLWRDELHVCLVFWHLDPSISILFLFYPMLLMVFYFIYLFIFLISKQVKGSSILL